MWNFIHYTLSHTANSLLRTARSVGPKYITFHAKNPYLSDTDMHLCIVDIRLCPFGARIILKM